MIAPEPRTHHPRMTRAIITAALAILAGSVYAQTGEPTGPTTSTTQPHGAQPAGPIQAPERLREPAGPQQQPQQDPARPFGGPFGGPIEETGKYDSLGQGKETGAGDDRKPGSLVEPDYRRSETPGSMPSRP